MTCYMRHMHWLFEAIDLPYNEGNRKKVDAALRTALGMPEDARCPEVWGAVKTLSIAETAALPARVLLAIGR